MVFKIWKPTVKPDNREKIPLTCEKIRSYAGQAKDIIRAKIKPGRVERVNFEFSIRIGNTENEKQSLFQRAAAIKLYAYRTFESLTSCPNTTLQIT